MSTTELHHLKYAVCRVMSRFKRTLKTVDYFDQEEDDDYGSALGVSVMPQSTFSHEEDEEEDPLDAFMRNNGKLLRYLFE